MGSGLKHYDVIVIGGGPGGSNLATHLAQAGIETAIFERENYPRFHIGESLLPASMPLLKETGFFNVLDSGKYIRKYGAQFIDYETEAEIRFGFEDGFNPDIPFAFEVQRADFDKDMLDYAEKCGAIRHQPERVTGAEFLDDRVIVKTNKGEYGARFVLDSTGRDALLGKRLSTRQANKDLNNVAIFAHYDDVKRFPAQYEGDITIGLLPNRSWTWIIPFKGNRTSVGVVCSSSQFQGRDDILSFMEERLTASIRVQDKMKNALRCSEAQMIGNYSHKTDKFFGQRWMLVGDSAVFLDPIFSTGVHVALKSSSLAADAVKQALAQSLTFDQQGLGETYQEQVLKGVNRFRNLVGLFYEGNFVHHMTKTLTREHMRKGFTSAVAGDVWNDDNYLFQKSVL